MTPDLHQRPLIHDLYETPLTGQAIEDTSLAIIDREAGAHAFPADQWTVVQRMIHTTADFGLIPLVRFSPDAVTAAVSALGRGVPIFTDSNMIRSGISIPRLQRVCADYDASSVHCHVSDPDVADLARAHGLPRSLFAVRKARAVLDRGIALFGNAPVALMELSRLIAEESIRPALVIAMPVGFVHVVESKDEMMTLGVPYIAIAGRRGGSPLAVSALHAICGLAEQGG
jgi:precorrin isomerase